MVMEANIEKHGYINPNLSALLDTGVVSEISLFLGLTNPFKLEIRTLTSVIFSLEIQCTGVQSQRTTPFYVTSNFYLCLLRASLWQRE